jgi:hypothetical protein
MGIELMIRAFLFDSSFAGTGFILCLCLILFSLFKNVVVSVIYCKISPEYFTVLQKNPLLYARKNRSSCFGIFGDFVIQALRNASAMTCVFDGRGNKDNKKQTRERYIIYHNNQYPIPHKP